MPRPSPAHLPVQKLAERVLHGQRLSASEALALFDQADLGLLGMLADEVRWRKHPEPVVTYIIDRNINPTNICVTDCSFCAFYRGPKDEGGYLLTRDELYRKVEETVALGGVQILMQGGHHPRLTTAWFCELFTDIKERWPALHLHAMSPPEIDHLAKVDKSTTLDVLKRLQAAGMDSIPGGGAEILVERVRKIIAPRKATTDQWLQVMREAHILGMRTTATMMFGHVETAAERVEHLDRLRTLQDETGGFTAFIPWTFQPHGTPLGDSLRNRKATYSDYFRTLAISRIYLDNFDNIQASFVTQGPDSGSMSLRMGANDFGSAMLEENVVSATGCHNLVPIDEIESRIRAAGCAPRQRNMHYRIIDGRGPLPADGELDHAGGRGLGLHTMEEAAC